jgi:hypothetical protein
MNHPWWDRKDKDSEHFTQLCPSDDCHCGISLRRRQVPRISFYSLDCLFLCNTPSTNGHMMSL